MSEIMGNAAAQFRSIFGIPAEALDPTAFFKKRIDETHDVKLDPPDMGDHSFNLAKDIADAASCLDDLTSFQGSEVPPEDMLIEGKRLSERMHEIAMLFAGSRVNEIYDNEVINE
jgi:hypothetical protein